jgi:hypothetical protein
MSPSSSLIGVLGCVQGKKHGLGCMQGAKEKKKLRIKGYLQGAKENKNLG